MNKIKEIHINSSSAVILCIELNMKNKNSFSVIVNKNNRNELVEKNLDYQEAKKIYNERVASL